MKGINIADRETVISQLADNTTIFLKNARQVPIALHVIEDFSKGSGLVLNLNVNFYRSKSVMFRVFVI